MKAARLSRSNHREGLGCGMCRIDDDHHDHHGDDKDDDDGDDKDDDDEDVKAAQLSRSNHCEWVPEDW